MATEGLITTQGEFLQYCDHCGVTLEGREFLRETRKGIPSRSVQSGGWNVPNDYPSEKMGMVISNESHTVELGFIYQCEYARKVREYYPQALRLTCHDRGPKGKPIHFGTKADLVVLEVDRVVLVETKADGEMERLAAKYPTRYKQKDGRWICPPAIKAAAELGFAYEIRTTAEISVNFSRWAEYLRPYYARPLEVSIERTKIAREFAERHPIVTLEDFRKALAGKVSIDELNALIAHSTLYVDWNAAPPTEPDSAFVFADREALYAFSSSRVKRPIRDFLVEVRPGRPIDWLGEIRLVLNVGDDVVSLDHNCDIPRERFESLIKIGSIGSVPVLEDDYPTSEEKQIVDGADRKEIRRASEEAEKILDYIETGKKPEDIKERTLRRKAAKVKEALRKCGNALLGVIRRKPSGNPHPVGSMDAESAVYLDNDIKKRFEKSNSPDAWNCWAKYKRAGECDNKKRKNSHLKLLLIVSYEKYRDAVRKRRGEAQTRRRFGHRAANQVRIWIWCLLPLTPRHGDYAFHIAHIDHTLIDLQTLTKHPGSKKRKRRKGHQGRIHGRLWWTTMVDAFSRRILAQYITYDSPSYRSCMMVIRECVRRHNRLPQTLVVDNGKEFRSCYFRFLAADFKIAVKFRPKGNPRFGSVQERPFGTANKQFFHQLFGNTKLTKNIRFVVKSHNPILLAVWNLQALAPVLEKWSYRIYDTRSHAALGMSPRDVFVQGLTRGARFNNTYIPFSDTFIFLTSPTTRKGTAKVIENGPYVVINYIKYFSKAFNNPRVLGKQVEVRYDPYDVGHAWAYIGRKWVECISEYYSKFHGKSEKLIRMAADEINARNCAHPISRRTVNATTLAEFLDGIDENEELLLQALRDEESRDLRDRLSSTDAVKAPVEMTKPGPKVATSQAPSAFKKPVKSVRLEREACEVI